MWLLVKLQNLLIGLPAFETIMGNPVTKIMESKAPAINTFPIGISIEHTYCLKQRCGKRNTQQPKPVFLSK
jgi:hypothetical protein